MNVRHQHVHVIDVCVVCVRGVCGVGDEGTPPACSRDRHVRGVCVECVGWVMNVRHQHVHVI